MTNKEKTKNVVQSSVQQKSFRTQNVVQTDGQEIRAFALPCLLEQSPITYCAKFERQFGFTRSDGWTEIVRQTHTHNSNYHRTGKSLERM